MEAPTIYVLAGVNGSGKSSIGGEILSQKGLPYYNPDLAARKLRELHPMMTQKIANSHAWSLGRDMLIGSIEQRKNFAFETTLGGKTITSLLFKAANEGIRVAVWYAGLESVEMNMDRVKARVASGGHDIPEEDIRKRWSSSPRNLLLLLPMLSMLRLYDNSLPGDPKSGGQPKPRLLLAMDEGRITGPEELSGAPDWAKPIIVAASRLGTA
ncbi:MAG: zeta toxin family protein [Opitutales bacterium]